MSVDRPLYLYSSFDLIDSILSIAIDFSLTFHSMYITIFPALRLHFR